MKCSYLQKASRLDCTMPLWIKGKQTGLQDALIYKRSESTKDCTMPLSTKVERERKRLQDALPKDLLHMHAGVAKTRSITKGVIKGTALTPN